MNQIFNIKCFSQEGGRVNYSEFVDLDIDIQIRQKVSQVAKEIYDNLSEREQADTKSIEFLFNKDTETLQIALVKANGSVDFSLEDLDHDSRLRLKELINIIHELGTLALMPGKGILRGAVGRQIQAIASESLNPITKIFLEILRWFVSYFTLTPQVKTFSETFFRPCETVEELEDRFKNSAFAINDFIDQTHQELNKDRKTELFSKSDVFKIVNRQIDVEFLKEHKKLSGITLTDCEISAIKNEGHIKLLVPLFDEISKQNEDLGEEMSALEDLQKTWDDEVLKMSSLDIPYKYLASVPITLFNEESLLKTWTTMLHDLRQKGNLKDDALPKNPREAAQKIRYADTYLFAVQQLPPAFKQLLAPLTNQVDIKKIDTFVWNNPNSADLKSLPQQNTQKKRQIIVQETVRPVRDEILNEMRENYTDGTAIAQLLSVNEHENMGEWLNKIEEKIEPYHLSAAERETLHLTKKDLTEMYFSAVEQFAMDEYYITGNQIRSIQQLRASQAVEAKVQQAVLDLKNIAIQLKDLTERKNDIETQIEKFNEDLQKGKNRKNKRAAAADKPRLDGLRQAKAQSEYELQGLISQRTRSLKKVSTFLMDNFDQIPVSEMIQFLEPLENSAENQEVVKDIWNNVLDKLVYKIGQERAGSIGHSQAILNYENAKLASLKMNLPFTNELLTRFLAERGKKTSSNIIQKAQDDPENLFKLVKETNPLNLRPDLLAAIPVTEENLEPLTNMWRHIFAEALKKSDASHIDSMHYLFVMSGLQAIEDEGLKEKLQAFISPLFIDNEIKAVFSQRQKQIEERLVALSTPTIEEILSGKSGIEEPINDYFTKDEVKNLLLLTKALGNVKTRNGVYLSNEEKAKLSQFIDKMTDSAAGEELNAKLYKITSNKAPPQSLKDIIFETPPPEEDNKVFKKVPYGISSSAAQLIIAFSYQLKNLKKFPPLLEKLDKLNTKIQNGEEVKKEDKLTERELGLLLKCSKLVENPDEETLFSQLEELNLVENNPKLKEIKGMATKVQGLLKALNTKFEAESPYHTGDFVAYVGSRKNDFLGHKNTVEDRLHFNLITPYAHGAKIFINEEGKRMLSHVGGRYYQSPYSIFEDSFSEVWRLDVPALIPKEMVAVFKEMYPNDWKAKLQEKYEAIEFEVQQNRHNQFDDMTNPHQRRWEAGKADYIWGGHVKEKETDFTALAEQIMGDPASKREHRKMAICSEFVTLTTIASLVQLNKDLTQEVSGFLINKGRVEEGEKLKAKGEVFEMPYSKKEKLKAVHPGRMIDLLKKKNCIQRIKQPKIMQSILKH